MNFDVTVPRVLLGGKSGPMDTAYFRDLVDRNRRADSISWEVSAEGLCTMYVGNPEWGDARNVPTPQIPEFTDFIDKENSMGIRARGWRMLLYLFITDRWIYPSQEIRKWLGDFTWDHARWVVE